jgi:sec-independent protein translocase protein TatC
MLHHLLELRRRALATFACFIILFVMFFFLAPNLFHQLMWPLLLTLPAQNSLVATSITAPVMTPINLAADVAMICTTPFALWHVWRFIAPGLYRHERRYFCCAVAASLTLFLTGIIFCFYGVLPWMFQFFIHSVPYDVRLMPDMVSVADFITRMLFIFGLCFQIPLICLCLVKLQLLQVDTLKKCRPYIIVMAFTLGMLLTPPDVFSQALLALPICILYELGLFFTVYCAQYSR